MLENYENKLRFAPKNVAGALGIGVETYGAGVTGRSWGEVSRKQNEENAKHFYHGATNKVL